MSEVHSEECACLEVRPKFYFLLQSMENKPILKSLRKVVSTKWTACTNKISKKKTKHRRKLKFYILILSHQGPDNRLAGSITLNVFFFVFSRFSLQLLSYN